MIQISDLISRQKAIDALKICDANYDGTNCDKCPLRDERWDGAWEDDETNCYTKLMRDSAKLLALPSAEPKLPIKRKCTVCPHCSNCDVNDDGTVKTAEPERKKGEWVRNFDGNEWYWLCSNCKEEWYEEDLWMGGNSFPNYCPNCGCQMNGGDTDETN